MDVDKHGSLLAGASRVENGPRLEEMPLESENLARLAKLQVPIAAAVRNLHFREPRLGSEGFEGYRDWEGS